MEKYRYWNILETLPDGWVIDNTAGSPAPNTVFITNGKSVLKGQKRALLKIKPKRDINAPKNEIVENHFVDANKMIEKTEIPIFPAKTVNDVKKNYKSNDFKQQSLFDELT